MDLDMNELSIPNNWAQVTFDEVISFNTGYAFKSSEFKRDGIFVLRVTNINDSTGKIERKNCRYISKNDFNSKYKKFELNNEDILIVMVGASTGKIGIVTNEQLPAVLNQNMWNLKPFENCVSKKYLFFYLNFVRKDVLEGAGGSARGFIKQSDFKKRLFPLPPSLEQERIIQKIETCFQKIDSTEQNLTKAKNLLDILQKRFFNGLVDSFELVELQDLIKGKPQNGFSPPSVNERTKVKNLKLSATTYGKFDKSKFKYVAEEIPSDSRYWLKDGDILIQRSNSLNYIGATALYRGKDKEFIYPDLMMKINANNLVLEEYLTFSLQLSETQLYFRKNASGAASNMPKINQKIILKTPIPITSIENQRKILSQVCKFKKSITFLENDLRKTQKVLSLIKDSILSTAFEGRLVEQKVNEGTGHELLKQILRTKSSETVKNSNKKIGKRNGKK